jgi:hypothetical protein
MAFKAKGAKPISGFRCSFFQQMIRCSNKSCRCRQGLLHGPYWYARVYLASGKRRNVYIGKQLPADVAHLRTLAHDLSA